MRGNAAGREDRTVMNNAIRRSIQEIIEELQSLEAESGRSGADEVAIQKALDTCSGAIREARNAAHSHRRSKTGSPAEPGPGFGCDTACLDAAFANLPDSIFILDRNLACVYAHAPVMDLRDPAGRAAGRWDPFLRHAREVFTTGIALRGEFSPGTAGRSQSVCDYLINPFYGPSGSVDYIFAVCRDISQQRRLELALRESRDRYRALFESMATGFAYCEIVCDDRGEPADYRFLEINPAFEALAGIGRDCLVGRTIREILPDIGGEVIASLGRAAQTGLSVRFEHYNPVLEKYLDIIAFCPERGKFGCLVEDITAIKRTEQERARLMRQIQSERKRLEAVLQQMPCGVILTEAPSGRLVLANDRMREIWPCSLPEGEEPCPGGSSEGVRLGWRPYEIDEYPFSRIIRTGEAIIDDEIEILRGDGTTGHVCISAAPVRDPDGVVRYGVMTFSDVSRRKAAEEELQESEEFNRKIFESVHECIKVLDLDGNLISMSPYGLQELGIADITPYLGTNFLCFWEEEHRDMVAEALSAARRNGRGQFEAPCRTAAGEMRYWEVVVTPICDPQGVPERLLATSRDITERKRSVEALRRREQELKVLLASLPTGVVVVDAATHRILDANPTALALFKAPREEVVGKCCHNHICPAEEGNCPITDQGSTFDRSERVVLTADGEEVPVLKSVARVHLSGRPCLIESFVDISDRKRAEEEIRVRNQQLAVLNRIIAASASALASDELLRDTLDATLEHMEFDVGAVYLLDPDRQQAVLRCHREMPDRYLSRYRTLNALLSPYDDLFAAGEPRYIEAGETAPARQDLAAALGVSSLAFIPIVAESSVIGTLVLGSTGGEGIPQEARRILEAVGREVGAGILRGMLYPRIEAANREANLYLDILTHDIRNAENVTLGYADLLDETLSGVEREYLQKLRAGIKKSIEITANVGTIRKIRESRAGLVPVDLDRVVREEIAHRPDARITYDGLAVAVLADDLLPEVFTNLIGNAAKHGGPDVEIAIAVEEGPDEGTVRVSVADTGPGVPDDVKEAIFARFEQGKARGSGQGLGLSICRMLLARYGGTIRAEDRLPGRPEEGAAFRFTLRRVEDGEPPEREA
ncbi:PAS domain-containing protein [Methanoculleus sp. Wushi-C6]|uniref:histidine kinase n=1 Tax=Methanoculleus caldifontis TaxID=2651577 RepID=A0ABU3WXR5_9EURY|nr:PAS domain-containing protein [Methanoculleus sp. Wushi-C6]MDV2480594.1 PAS domain-containing protein [Methanoculleus sp. Wushi-C6]